MLNVNGVRRILDVALHRIKHHVLEDKHRIGIAKRRGKHVSGVGYRGGSNNFNTRYVRVPSF